MGTKELSFDEALAMARRANRTLTAEHARLDQAKANVDRAWTVLFPTVAAQGKYAHNNTQFVFATSPTSMLTIQPLNQLDASVQMTMPLLVPAAYPALKAVNLNEQISREQYDAAVDNVLFAVAQTYYAAAVADEVVAARQSGVTVAKATLGNAEARFSAGTVTKVDVDRAQLALLRAEQSGA